MRALARGMILATAVLALPARAIDLRWSAEVGTSAPTITKPGLGGRLEVVAYDVFRGIPLGFSFGVGYTRVDPGDPLLARKVFVNQNTNGTPEKSGYVLDFKLDAIWFFHVKGYERVGIFGGLRHDMFRADFRYVGGDEDFEVTADDWGLGVGARGEMRLTRRLSLVGTVGLDFYPVSSLYGHDATYSSDGSSTNARDNGNGYTYTWKDADKAINQPRLMPSLMVGLAW
ncbi:MAG TPA: hypothetical protein VMU15_10775 [Anaeromyxobacter sp.]|nr:hypothetical protein [Anaeromyxobacter sp.]